MPLLDYHAFSPLLSQFKGKTIGFFEAAQDLDSRSRYLATKQICYRYGIKHVTIGHQKLDQLSSSDRFDLIAVTGSSYPPTELNKHDYFQSKLTKAGFPLILFPQHIVKTDHWLEHYQEIFVQDNMQAAKFQTYSQAPDLLLGFETRNYDAYPQFEYGVFVTTHTKLASVSLTVEHQNLKLPHQYYYLISHFKQVITDNLEIAVLALSAGRKVYLLPDENNRNKAYFDTWLKELNCVWSDHEDWDSNALGEAKQSVESALWAEFASTGTKPLDLSYRYRLGAKAKIIGDSTLVVETPNQGNREYQVNSTAVEILQTLNQSNSLQEAITQLSHQYDTPEYLIGPSVVESIAQFEEIAAIKACNEDFAKAPITIQPLPIYQDGDNIIVSARIAIPNQFLRTLWFAVPKEASHKLTRDRADVFVLAVFWQAMHLGCKLIVKDLPVSKSLIANLKEYQTIWQQWSPTIAKTTTLVCDTLDSSPAKDLDASLMAFSGGVDSSYTLLRLLERNEKPPLLITAHGFDVPVSEKSAFEQMHTRINQTLAQELVSHISITSNARSFSPKWDFSHAAAIASMFSLFSNTFSKAYLASTFPNSIESKWGSNPTTDPLLGTDQFIIEHHGSDTTRFNKLKALTAWPSIIENLKVCWSFHSYDRNCGQCQKCVLLQLSLRALDQPLTCFDTPLSEDELISKIPRTFPGILDLADMRELDQYCINEGLNTKWAKSLNSAVEIIETEKERRII